MNPFRLATRLTASREAVSRRSYSRMLGGLERGDVRRHEEVGAEGGGAAGSASGGAAGRDAGAAIRVPWRIERRSASGVDVVNVGSAPLRAVRFALGGRGLLGLSLPRTVRPGERLRVVLRGATSDGVRGAPDAVLTLRWFQPDGSELLWPIAL